jgi:drug/metabolite transporter (DMT)-like permease
MPVAPREDRTGLGLGTMALAVAFFTLIDTSAKWLILAGLSAIQVVFVRYTGHFLVSALIYLPREGISAFRSNSPGRQILRSLFLFGSTFLNFTALKCLPITVTTTIMFASPIAVTLLAIPVLGEKVGLRRFLAVLAGFSGVLVAMQPWGAEYHPAMFLSFGALIVSSLYFVMTRLLAGIESNAISQL